MIKVCAKCAIRLQKKGYEVYDVAVCDYYSECQLCHLVTLPLYLMRKRG